MAKILLIEDNPTIRDMLTRRLRKRGYEVAAAADGAAGVDAVASDRPDVILMDLHLPVLDGWEATRRLKNAASTRDLPIIALTADAMSGDQEKALQAGCDDYETKPIDLPQLLRKVENLLKVRAKHEC
jgi:CheY-like chemotaxis protein